MSRTLRLLVLISAMTATLISALSIAGPVTQASGTSSVAVHVSGNHLVNEAGEILQLRGVNLSGSEFACSGDLGNDGWSILDTPTGYSVSQQISEMSTWDINAVRIPLNEDCWLGINGISSSYAGANYVAGITDLVTALNDAGMIAILDLHYNAPGTQVSDSTGGLGGTGQQVMADADHAPTFWKSVATQFKSNPGVIFDLYNEPFAISWSCWKSGGCNAPAVEGTKGNWPIAGMQNLVNAVRSTGADQPIMLGGLNYANDVTQWLTNEPTDTLSPAQLIASVHVYDGENCDDVSCWNSQIAPVAAQVPVVTGEFGPSSCDGNFVDTYMNWSDAVGVSYLAWTWGSVADGWSCANSPALLESDDGTPDAYGAAIKSHYQALATSAVATATTTTTNSVSASPVVAVTGATFKVKRGYALIPVSCEGETCATTVVFTLRTKMKESQNHHVKTLTRTVIIGSGSASVPAGESTSIIVRFNKEGLAALAFARSHRIAATLSVSTVHTSAKSLNVILLT